MKIYRYGNIDSTQKVAKKFIEDGAGCGCVIVADSQTGGRGRLDRAWISPDGGLYCSIILKINPMLPLIAGVAIVTVLQRIGIDAAIKWPNDIIVHGKKLAGVLIEISGEFAIVGIGINIDSSPVDASTSLCNEDVKVSRDVLLASLLDCFLETLAYTKQVILASYRKFSFTLGKRVKVQMCDGEMEGHAVGIDEDGGLLIENSNDGRMRKVMAGDCIHMV